MLATMQEYAQEKLEASGEQVRVQERYVRYLLTLARTAEPHLYRPEGDIWLERLDSEDANLRAALAWCSENRYAVEIGLDLAGTLSFFWYKTGRLREGLSALQAMLARTAQTERSHVRAKALYGAGLLSWKQAKAEDGAHYAEEALSIFRERGDRLWSGEAELLLATSRLSQPGIAPVRPLLEECLAIFKEVKHRWGEAFALGFLGLDSEIRGNYEEALSYYRESVQRSREVRDAAESSVLLGALAGARASMGDKDAARSYLEELQRLVLRANTRWPVGAFLEIAGFNLQSNYHRYETAKLLYQGSLSLWREIQRVEGGMGIIRGLMGLAEIAAIQGEGERSGWLFGAADHLTPSSGFHRDTLNERLAQTREQLDATTKPAFDAARAEGQRATLEQAIERALQETT